MSDGMGTTSIQNPASLFKVNCSAYDFPSLLAYQIAKPPARLLVAEPAPSLTVSERETSSRFRSKALFAATPKAAKPEAEKPKPLPSLRLFSETTLKCPLYLARLLSLFRMTSTLCLSLGNGFLPLMIIMSPSRVLEASTVVMVCKASIQTEMLSWKGILFNGSLNP